MRLAPPRQVQGVAPLRLGYLVDSLTTGGAERLIVTFAEQAKRHPEVDLTVFILTDGPTAFRQELDELGVAVVALPGGSLVDPRRFLRLTAALRERSIEYLHAHLISSTVLGGLASWRLGIPFAATVHNVRPSAKRVRRVRQGLYRMVLRRPGVRRIAVGSAVAAAAAADAGGRPFEVVPNAVTASAVGDPASRGRLRAELGLAPGTVALLAVGALIPQKGYFDLLEAYAAMPDTEVPNRLFVAGHSGSRDLGPALELRVRELGLSGRVSFLGLRRDVPDLLAACDVFVSASHWEGAPVSLLEALANGLPCVVTDVGDNRPTLAGTASRLVAPGEPARLAEAMHAMVSDPELRARAAADSSERATSYHARAWVTRLLGLYAEQTPRTDWWAGPGEAGGA